MKIKIFISEDSLKAMNLTFLTQQEKLFTTGGNAEHENSSNGLTKARAVLATMAVFCCCMKLIANYVYRYQPLLSEEDQWLNQENKDIQGVFNRIKHMYLKGKIYRAPVSGTIYQYDPHQSGYTKCTIVGAFATVVSALSWKEVANQASGA